MYFKILVMFLVLPYTVKEGYFNIFKYLLAKIFLKENLYSCQGKGKKLALMLIAIC